MLECLEERFLCHFLGIRLIMHDRKSSQVYTPLLRANEFIKQLFLTGAHTTDQRRFVAFDGPVRGR